MLRLLLATALAASAPFVPNDPGYGASRAQLDALSVPQAWSLTQGDPGVVIAVVADGVAHDPDLDLVAGDGAANGRGTAPALVAAAQIDNGIGGAGVCGRCRVMPVQDVRWAIDHGADAVLLVDCVAPRDIAAALAHGLPVVGCGTLDAGDPAVVAGIVGLMLSCNPALTPDEVRLILLQTAPNARDAVVRAGCRQNPSEVVRLLIHTRGGGAVTKSPDDDTYNAGSVIVLRARAEPGWRFAHWRGLCRGSRPTCVVRLRHSGAATAVFKRGV
jgi:subtilisin family serine protease